MDSRIREALEWYADEMNYFPRTLIRLAQEKHIQLAPVYSEFGEKAREALALLDDPVASDARELALELAAGMWEPDTLYVGARNKWLTNAAPTIESFAAECERKAREKMIASHREYEKSVDRRWTDALAKHDEELRKAREETARKCADAVRGIIDQTDCGFVVIRCKKIEMVTIISAIMEAAHE